MGENNAIDHLAYKFGSADTMKIQSSFIVIAVVFAAMAYSFLAGSGRTPRASVAVEPISAIITAFNSHSIVALDEGNHGNEQGHAFRLSLIRDPRFAAFVNDIVVEFGDARYQDLMDRFVRGESIPDTALRQVWQNTTQPTSVWDAPIYEEFFRAVRTVNLSLPPEHQLRVLLGDPPIDWDSLPKSEDFLARNSYPVDLIRKEVLAKKRRALVIYGGMHFLRENPYFDKSEVKDPGIVNRLENQDETKVFTIWTDTLGGDIKAIQPEVELWPQPSLTMLSGTVLGAQDFAFYYPYETSQTKDGKTSFIMPRQGLHMENEFDALLYLGPTSTITYSEPSAELCADPAYVTMRIQRLSFMGDLSGDYTMLDEFRRYCEGKSLPGTTSGIK